LPRDSVGSGGPVIAQQRDVVGLVYGDGLRFPALWLRRARSLKENHHRLAVLRLQRFDDDVGSGCDQRAVAHRKPGAAEEERRASRLLERPDGHDRRLDARDDLGQVALGPRAARVEPQSEGGGEGGREARLGPTGGHGSAISR
jgi:hypothetical protein